LLATIFSRKMGFVDDYCGGVENLALYTDDDGDVDFEGAAYESGLDGSGFGFGGGLMGLDQWPVDVDEWDEDMEEDTIYRVLSRASQKCALCDLYIERCTGSGKNGSQFRLTI
jgi:hypothetical protein